MDMNEIIKGVVLTKECSIKADNDSDESKRLTVKMNYDGLTMQDIFTKALSSDVIKWQAGARKRFDSFTDKQTVEVSAKSPGGSPQIDPETAMVAKLKGMSPDEQKAYIENMLAKAIK